MHPRGSITGPVGCIEPLIPKVYVITIIALYCNKAL